eukprot:1186185-Prorocentrum_minimum.AAC.3
MKGQPPRLEMDTEYNSWDFRLNKNLVIALELGPLGVSLVQTIYFVFIWPTLVKHERVQTGSEEPSEGLGTLGLDTNTWPHETFFFAPENGGWSGEYGQCPLPPRATAPACVPAFVCVRVLCSDVT